MPLDLARLLDPAHTAVLTSECQDGIIGPASRLGALVDAVRAGGMIDRIAELLDEQSPPTSPPAGGSTVAPPRAPQAPASWN